MDKKVKIAAVISAAVMNYINTEEGILSIQQAGLQAGQFAPGGVEAAALPPFNIWGLSGRQALMQTRNMMQFKAFIRGRQ